MPSFPQIALCFPSFALRHQPLTLFSEHNHLLQSLEERFSQHIVKISDDVETCRSEGEHYARACQDPSLCSLSSYTWRGGFGTKPTKRKSLLVLTEKYCGSLNGSEIGTDQDS